MQTCPKCNLNGKSRGLRTVSGGEVRLYLCPKGHRWQVQKGDVPLTSQFPLRPVGRSTTQPDERLYFSDEDIAKSVAIMALGFSCRELTELRRMSFQSVERIGRWFHMAFGNPAGRAKICAALEKHVPLKPGGGWEEILSDLWKTLELATKTKTTNNSFQVLNVQVADLIEFGGVSPGEREKFEEDAEFPVVRNNYRLQRMREPRVLKLKQEYGEWVRKNLAR